MENRDKNFKLELVEEELKALLRKLVEGNYHLTAEQVYDLIANSGVEMELDPSLKDKETMEEFLNTD